MGGLLITFEGPDGAGKTTQINRVAQWLKSEGILTVQTREPGGTAIGDKIRQLLLNPAHGEMADQTEILLYAASRAQLVNEVIRKALKNDKVVLSDRFVDASLAYQGFGLGYGLEQIRLINRLATGGIRPHRTYLLDIPVEMGLRRVKEKRDGLPDRIEQKGYAYHLRVREGFLSLAKEEPDRFRVIDAREAEDTVFRHIQADLKALLFQKGGGRNEARNRRRSR